MHLGLVLYGGLNLVSGGFLYDRQLVRHFESRGDKVEVISIPWSAYGRGLVDNLSPNLGQRLRRAHFEVLLEDELAHPSLVLLNRWLRRRVSYPLVAIVHHLRSSEARAAWKNQLYRRVESSYLASVDGFICNSQTTRAEVQSLVGAGRPVVVAPPGGDHLPGKSAAAQVAARALAPGPLKIIVVANLIPRKGIHTLISALASLPHHQWQLTVAGSLDPDSRYAASLRRQAEQEQVSAGITWLGSVSDQELAVLLPQHHLLAVPSFYEGFGIVYLEAMRFGLPVIAGDAGGVREIVHHGVDGFLTPPGDPVVLSRHLASLIEDRDLLRRLSLAALTGAASHPTWEASAARVREFLGGFNRAHL